MPENSVNIEIPEKLTFFFDQNYVRYRVAYGGRASGKSWARLVSPGDSKENPYSLLP